MRSLSENIYYLRLVTGWSIREAADKLGCAPNTLSNWENGKVSPPADYVQKICRLYGVSADEIFGLKDCAQVEDYIALNEEILSEIEVLREQRNGLDRRIKYLSDLLRQRKN